MPELLIPRSVAMEIQKRKWAEQRAEFRATLEELFDFNDPECVRWNPHLKALDPLLRLGRARPRGAKLGFTVMPNFYHWVRENETAAPTVTPITGPNGEFRTPDSGVLEDLAMSDLQNPRVFMDLLARRKAKEEQAEKDKELLRQERQTEIMDRWLAGNRVQVSMNRSTPWTQNARGRKAKKQ